MGLPVSFLDNSKTTSLISMFTLHLSRFFDGPPGRNLQKLNAIIHREPYSTIAHGTYWSIVLLFGAPLVGISLLCISLYELLRYFFWNRRRIEPKSIEQELAVVITGCDSGFGKEMAFRLAAEGFIVFAGCLQEKSLKHFACESLIRPIVLDVTSDKDIEASFQAVQEWLTYSSASNRNGANVKRRHLHALVNNAGLGRIGYVDWLELSDYKICMEGEFWELWFVIGLRYIRSIQPNTTLTLCFFSNQVNCFAQIRMVRAFLPVFKKQAIDRTYGDAQVVNMISMAGMLSGGGFAGTAYEVSKNAAEAFTDGLRLEMKMFGVKVVAVNPSFHETPLVASVPERLKAELWEPLSPDLKEEYGQGESAVNHLGRLISSATLPF